MREKIQLVSLKEVVKKPEFTDIYGLREYLVSILDESEKRNKLDPQGIINVNKSRKKSLCLGWREGSFMRRLVIEETKDKKTISVGFELQCSETKNKYFTEKYNIIGRKPEDPVEDLLYFSHTNNLEDPQKTSFLDIDETKAGLRRIKGMLLRVIEFNCI